MIVAILYDIKIRKTRLSPINIFFGALVGAFNFGNILFYLKAHQAFADNPSTVFAAMNMGVIILGSLLGILVFKEKMSRRNYVGLALALVSIVLIALSQMNI
jgi:drug/metabolite transporter (DMT)-like permease